MSVKKRLPLLVCLGLALVFLGFAAKYFWFSRPMGTGPAGPAVDAKCFDKKWTEQKVLFLGVGDSVTAGFGVPAAYSYFGRLAKNPHDEFPDMQGRCLSAVLPNLETKNIAVSGSTSLQHVDIIKDRLDVQDKDTLGLVVMTTGGNDLIHSYGQRPPREGAMYGATLAQAKPWIAAFARRLDELIDLIEARFPGGCQVFLADIYDPTDAVGDAPAAGLPAWPDGLAIHETYNDAIRRTAEKHDCVHLVPMREAFLGHGIHCTQFWREHYRRRDPHYWYASNLEDPNIRGYDAIRRVFLREIAAVLDNSPAGGSEREVP